MIHLRNFVPSDITKVKDIVLDTSVHNNDSIEAWAIHNYNCGPAYTAVAGTEIVAVVGVRIVRTGIGHGWAGFTPYMKKNVKECLRCLLDGINILEDAYGLKKIRTLVCGGFTGGHILVRHLHFTRKRYIKETDQFLYVRKAWDL